MDFGSTLSVVSIVLVCTSGWLINNWIRAKHGYPLENEWGGTTERSDTSEALRLKAENKALHDKLDTMQDRMIVLEKIVTDRGYSLAEEIEALRDTRRMDVGSGVPLGLANKERV
jgi:hypothetical protein